MAEKERSEREKIIFKSFGGSGNYDDEKEEEKEEEVEEEEEEEEEDEDDDKDVFVEYAKDDDEEEEERKKRNLSQLVERYDSLEINPNKPIQIKTNKREDWSFNEFSKEEKKFKQKTSENEM